MQSLIDYSNLSEEQRSSGNTRLDNWQKFSNKHYYQEVISIPTKNIIDGGPYEVNINGKILTWKPQSTLHPLLQNALDKAFETNSKKAWAIADALADTRKYPGAGVFIKDGVEQFINPFVHGKNGISDADAYGLSVPKQDQSNPNIQHAASVLIHEIIAGNVILL